MVTGRSLPWFWLCMTLGACGGSADFGAGAGGAPAQPLSGGKTPRGETQPGQSVGKGTGVGGMSSEIGGTSSSEAGMSAGESSLGGASGGAPPHQYPGRGFVVHEWGTDTVVVGSDGSLQRGLHHEEEDLPAFVYDRIKAGELFGSAFSPSVTIKMETPVTYFYSDVPLTARASVFFPKGVLTQWYPRVTSFLPPIVAPNAIVMNEPLTYIDPVLDPSFPFSSDMCRARYGTVGSGQLDWGSISILPREANVDAQLPPAALDQFSWSYARDVASNPVQTAGGETERFLFYRGLGNFELPVSVKVTGPGIAGLGGNPVTLQNQLTESTGALFMMNVGPNEAVFKQVRQGIAPGGTLADQLPMLYGTTPLDPYTEQLGAAVTSALDDTGLYHDEAVAMVNTWKHQWFRTPGIRLLYVIPQQWTDASIPLTIWPKPDSTLRVMLIRVEVITPEQEAEDVAALSELDNKAGFAHFTALGRFAEPRLRRALALAPSAAGQDYLAQISTADTAVVSGE